MRRCMIYDTTSYICIEINQKEATNKRNKIKWQT